MSSTDPQAPLEEYINESGYITKEYRILGTVCYLPFGFIVPSLIGRTQSAYITFHTKQGLIAFAPVLVLWIFGSFMWGVGCVIYLALAYIFGSRAYAGEMYTFEIMESFFTDIRRQYAEENKQKEDQVL